MTRIPVLRIVGGAALAIIVSLTLLWQVSDRRADRLADRLEQVRLDLSQCRANAGALEASIAAQNIAVEALHAESMARITELQERLSAASTRASAARSEAERLRDRPIQGVTQCERMTDVYEAIVRGAP
jgi:cell division septum initiation protein DivIVA